MNDITPHEFLDAEDLLGRIIRFRLLRPVFQPLFNTEDCTIYGFEGLIRGPEGTSLHSPIKLFAAAERQGKRTELEVIAARTIIDEFCARRLPGFLFVNLSCTALTALAGKAEKTLDIIMRSSLSPASLIIELTEHDRVADPEALVLTVKPFRDAGIRFALDDFGNGHSNLRLWMDLRPHVVKIDRFFIDGLSGNGDKFEVIRLLKRLGDMFNTRLVAEGIENESDLAVVKDLGIPVTQGYLLARPAADPERQPSEAARNVLQSDKISIKPQSDSPPERYSLVGELVVPCPPVTADTSNDTLARQFSAHNEFHAVAICENEKPVGLINRRRFMDQYAQPYHRELFGRKPCTLFMQCDPLIVDRRTPLESLQSILTGSDQRYLQDGFIITDNSRYIGLGTGESLVRAVTELRIEAARYANPLTALPGNIPITEHLNRLLSGKKPFVMCYADLNNFKPFNDQYGYWRGDLVIRQLAGTLVRHADPQIDFVGHVGGDDFVVVFQSDGWREHCLHIINEFNVGVREHFSKADNEHNGFWGEDRMGQRCFFPMTSLSIGAVVAHPGEFSTSEEVASAAAAAKRKAKHSGQGFCIAGECPEDCAEMPDLPLRRPSVAA
ncbi:MAG: GGDEF domain-containing protein [Burkholderiales bacterium]